MERCRGWPAQVNKIQIKRKLKNIDHTYRARQSGQGCVNKPIIIIIVMYRLKHN